MKIGLIGKQGSGKTTIAENLETLGYTKLSLADPLRDIVYDLLGVSKGHIEYRTVMQVVGTDCFRRLDPDVWIRHLLKRVYEQQLADVVVDDVRFVNEAESLYEEGWQLIFLDCDIETRRQRRTIINPAHPSETEIDSIKQSFGDRIHTIDATRPLVDVLADIMRFA